MENIRSFQKQLLCRNLPSQVVRSPASLLIQTAIELHDEFRRTDVLYRQQVFTHAYGISDAQTTLGLKRHNGLLFRDPVRSRIQPSIVNDQVPVIGKCIGRQTESSASRCFESPAGQQTVELIVNVGVADDMPTGISQ